MTKRTYKKRQSRTNEEKVSAVRRHLLENVPVTELCEELNISPALYYQWQKQFFENGEAAFTYSKKSKAPSAERQLERKLAHLETKLQKRDEVVTELMTEHLSLKKKLGEI